MVADLTNSKIQQAYEDFQYAKGDFDVVLKDAVADLSETLNKTDKRGKTEIANELTTFITDFSDKIAQGFSEVGFATRKELAPKLAQIYAFAIYNNPQNIQNILDASDKLMSTYAAKSSQDPEVYNAFKDIYKAVVRKSNSGDKNFKSATDRMNMLINKIEILRGSGTPEKYLSRLADNPQSVNMDNFIQSLKHVLTNEPEKACKNISDYVEGIAKIKDEKFQTKAYAALIIGFKNLYENSFKQTTDSGERKNIEKNMMKLLQLEEVVGLADMAEKYRTPFERKLAYRRTLDKKMYTLLNFANEDLGVEKKKDKPFYPSKKEMMAVANLLTQYKSIDYDLVLNITMRIDDKNFSNIDDRFIDTLLRDDIVNKMENGDVLKENLTEMRAKMHSRGIKQKTTIPHGVVVEKTSDKNKKALKTTDVIDIKKSKSMVD